MNMSITEQTNMKEIVRLLRFIGNSGCSFQHLVSTKASGGQYRLSRPDGKAEMFAETALGDAARRGVALIREQRVLATSEARQFLRRFLAAREEAFLDQHRVVEIVELRVGEDVEYIRFNASSSPLSALSRLKDSGGKPWFPGDALGAGERLARDFQYANLQPRITPSYEPRIGSRSGGAPGAGVEMKDSVVAARLRNARAVDAMGPELSGVALDICCFEKGLELVERERQWPARSAKLMLKTALLQLHRHYHPVPQPKRRGHAWGGEGYRSDLVF
jgi:hypothetical protein